MYQKIVKQTLINLAASGVADLDTLEKALTIGSEHIGVDVLEQNYF